jgi:hypothetical protein
MRARQGKRGICRCGPGDLVPKRGHRCGRCDRFVVGPARADESAFEIPQTRHLGERPRRGRGVVGSSPPAKESEEMTGRIVQRHVRERRAYAEDIELGKRRHRRRRQAGRAA